MPKAELSTLPEPELSTLLRHSPARRLTSVAPGGSVPAMRIRDLVSLVFALAFCCASIFGQTVASSMVGSVVDPADAAVAGAQVALTNTGPGAELATVCQNMLAQQKAKAKT